MWACARGHKDAMLVLNQWNPLALLGLANRCSFTSSTGYNQHNMTLPSASVDTEWIDAASSNNHHHVSSSSSSSSSSSPPMNQQPHNDSATVNLPFQPSPYPATFPAPPASTPAKSSFSPTELLAVTDRDHSHSTDESDDRDIDDSELLHVEQSLTISFTDDRPTSASRKRTTRLKKRTSVDIIPGFMQRRTSTPKISKTASVGDAVEIPAELSGSPDTWPMTVLGAGELRVSNSDSHLSGLAKLHSSAAGRDPMISMIDHDINSPPMMFPSDTATEIFSIDSQQPATYILPCESMAVDIGTFIVLTNTSTLNPRYNTHCRSQVK